MATVIIENVAAVPSGGTYTEFTGLTFSPVSTLTKAAGVFDAALGRYLRTTGNGINGGVPNQGLLSVTVRSNAASIMPSGAIGGFTGLTWTPAKAALTAIEGNTNPGSYDLTLIARGLMGAATPPTFGLLMVVFVSS